MARPVRPFLFAIAIVVAACARNEFPADPPPAPRTLDATTTTPRADDEGYVTPTEATVPPTCGWTISGEGLTGGNVADARYDPRVPGRAYAATGLQVYRSLDHGRSWELIGTTPAAVRQFAFPAGATEIVLAASSSGLLRSTDAGLSWSAAGLGGLSLSTITVHPRQPERIYVSAHGAGLLASLDGGRSWSTLTRGIPSTTFQSIVVDPADPRLVLASGDTEPPPGGATYRSTAQGSWVLSRTDRERPLGLAQCASEPALVYAGHSDGLFRSRDFGATWEPVFQGLGSTGLAVTLAPGDCDTIYVTAANQFGVGFYFSSDGGATFTRLTGGDIPFDWKSARLLSVDPTEPRRALGASHAGILFTEDGTRSFTVAPGIRGVRGLLAAGADGGLWLSSWGSAAWQKPAGSDVWRIVPRALDFNFTVSPDPIVSGRALVLAWPQSSVTDGVTTTRLTNLPNLLGAVFRPGSDVVVAASQVIGMVRSEDRGATWTRANDGLPDPWPTRIGAARWMNALALSTIDPDRIVVGTEGRGLFLSVDAGRSWTVTAPELAAESIAPVVYSAAIGFVVVTSSLGVFRSPDGVAWTHVDGLPSERPGPLAVDDAGRIYAVANGAISRGTWRDGAIDWAPFGETCLPAGITGMAAHGGKLFVSSPGFVFEHAQ